MFYFSYFCLSAGFVYHHQHKCKITILYYTSGKRGHQWKRAIGNNVFILYNNDMRIYMCVHCRRPLYRSRRLLLLYYTVANRHILFMQTVVRKKLNDRMFNIIFIINIILGVFIGFGRFTKLPFFDAVGVCRLPIILLLLYTTYTSKHQNIT